MRGRTRLELLTRAATARDRREYVEASRLYEQILEAFGPDPDVMRALADSEFSQYLVSRGESGHGRAALHWIRRAIELRPDRPAYHYELGSMLEHGVDAPDYIAAAEAYREATELEPYFEPALGNLALLHGVPETPVPLEEAISCCERALCVRPSRSLWKVMARLYREAGRDRESDEAHVESLLERYDETAIQY